MPSSTYTSAPILLQVDPVYVLDKHASSTNGDFSIKYSDEGGKKNIESTWERSAKSLAKGHKPLRRSTYKNITHPPALIDFRPVDDLVSTFRYRFGHVALFLYNSMCPQVIMVIPRPSTTLLKPFSPSTSRFMAPSQKDDSKLVFNVDDFVACLMDVGDGILHNSAVSAGIKL